MSLGGKVLEVTVPTPDRSYSVVVRSGVLADIGAQVRERLPSAGTVALISDSNVMPLYGARVRAALGQHGLTVVDLEVPAGEASKSPDVLLDLIARMLDAGIGRRDVAVALGGGVVGDLGGLAAALVMRGIPIVQCPTTLLAQVDASVGGKVAVDLPAGKNLLGAFHFPTCVCIDPDVLASLPDRELGCGLAEMLKHGALFAPRHFDALLAAADRIYDHDLEAVSELVAASVALKAACVSEDPLEDVGAGGGRVLLNLGHTLGHAIETASDLELLHGEAVALGLRAAARLSERRGLASPGLEHRMVDALERLRLPTDLDEWLTGDQGDTVGRALQTDKKRGAGTITYIALADLGQPRAVKLSVSEILTLLRP